MKFNATKSRRCNIERNRKGYSHPACGGEFFYKVMDGNFSTQDRRGCLIHKNLIITNTEVIIGLYLCICTKTDPW